MKQNALMSELIAVEPKRAQLLLDLGATLTPQQLQYVTTSNDELEENLYHSSQDKQTALRSILQQLTTNAEFFQKINNVLRTRSADLTPAQQQRLQYLLDQGAHIDARDERDLTPLLLCVALPPKQYNAALIKFLLRNGANASAKHRGAYSVLLYALHSECANSFDIETIELLLQQGADINTQRSSLERETLLTLAYIQHDRQKIEFLVEHGSILTEHARDNLQVELDWIDNIEQNMQAALSSSMIETSTPTAQPHDPETSARSTKRYPACCSLQ